MNPSAIKMLVFGSASLAFGPLASCVAPYAVSAGPSGNGTIYSAGYQTRSLPSGYRTEVIDDTSYYTHNGTYYRPRSGGYVVVEAPRHRGGDNRGPRRDDYDRGPRRDDDYRDDHRGHSQHREITRLPSGYRTVSHGGVRYYQSNGVYYQQRGQAYVIVQSPF